MRLVLGSIDGDLRADGLRLVARLRVVSRLQLSLLRVSRARWRLLLAIDTELTETPKSNRHTTRETLLLFKLQIAENAEWLAYKYEILWVPAVNSKHETF